MDNTAKEKIDEVDEKVKKDMGFFSWIQGFSKQVVSVTFIIFAAANIFYLFMIWREFSALGGDILSYMNTFIAEMHTTFRDVIGAYIVKAATENIIKIGGTYLESYLKTKASIAKSEIEAEYGEVPEDDTEDIEDHDFSDLD